MKNARILSLLAGVLAVSLVATKGAKAVAIDATTGSSIHVTGGSTTQDSATIKWIETERTGTLKLFIDSTAAATTSSKISFTVPVRGNSQTWKITRAFAPGVKYYFMFQGYYPTPSTLVAKYTTSGFFTMEKSTGLAPRLVIAPSSLEGWDASGRSLPSGAGVRLGRDRAGVLQPQGRP